MFRFALVFIFINGGVNDFNIRDEDKVVCRMFSICFSESCGFSNKIPNDMTLLKGEEEIKVFKRLLNTAFLISSETVMFKLIFS